MHHGRVACPVTGCGKIVKMQDLYDDTLAERRVARMRSSMASQRQTQDVSIDGSFEKVNTMFNAGFYI